MLYTMRHLSERELFGISSVIALCLFVVGGFAPITKALGMFSVSFQQAAVSLAPTLTIFDLRGTYRFAGIQTQLRGIGIGVTSPPPSRKIRILLVPGHEPTYGGTEFRSAVERNIVVDIAEKLEGYLSQNPKYEVMMARDKNAWHPLLADFFLNRSEDIKTFRDFQRELTRGYIQNGSILPAIDQVDHTRAGDFTSLHLYGINKWASENRYDITLHFHLNDYPRSLASAGTRNGFAVYVEDHQFANGAVSRALGEAIARRLNFYHATSSLPLESRGVIDDQGLIAVGSNNSVDNASVLIEYGYIYEPQFLDGETRELAVQDYAYETYLGLQDFFGDPIAVTYGSGALPYTWARAPAKGETSPEAYALQSALRYIGFYPPLGESPHDCPTSGRFGPCTERALTAFQFANALTPTGTVGPQTIAALEAAVGK